MREVSVFQCIIVTNTDSQTLKFTIFEGDTTYDFTLIIPIPCATRIVINNDTWNTRGRKYNVWNGYSEAFFLERYEFCHARADFSTPLDPRPRPSHPLYSVEPCRRLQSCTFKLGTKFQGSDFKLDGLNARPVTK